MSNQSEVHVPRNMRGGKWLTEAEYLTDADRAAVMAAVAECKRAWPEHSRTVGVRCPSYIGEPHPIATIIYGPGQHIYRSVWR